MLIIIHHPYGKYQGYMLNVCIQQFSYLLSILWKCSHLISSECIHMATFLTHFNSRKCGKRGKTFNNIKSRFLQLIFLDTFFLMSVFLRIQVKI